MFTNRTFTAGARIHGMRRAIAVIGKTCLGGILHHTLDDVTSKHYDKAKRLSEQDDLLSQWRGYADDASGAAIEIGRAHV